MKPLYKLTYFDIRGRGEPIRLLLTDNKIPFEDVRIASSEEWKKAKKNFTFGQLPCLQDEDVKIVQTGAIMRHLGRKHDLMGRTELDHVYVDMFYEGITDVMGRYYELIYGNYDEKSQFVDEYLPDALGKIEHLLKTRNDGKSFILGENISYADYALFEMLDVLLILSPIALVQFPTLKSLHQRLNQRPTLQAHLLDRATKNVRVNWNGKE